MRTNLENYNIISYETLSEVLEIMNKENPPTPIAGGTDLMVQLNYKNLPEGEYLNLHAIKELQPSIIIEGDMIKISPLTSYTDLILHPYFKENMSLLREAAFAVGAPGIQSRGTWAGNIMNASPAADGVPALMVYDAKLKLTSLERERIVSLDTFYKGYKTFDKKANEIITEIQIPIPKTKALEYYRKVGERRAQAISKVLLAARIELNEESIIKDARLIFASVMPYTYRARETEKILNGQKLCEELIEKAMSLLANELKPIDDIRSTARYRNKVARNLLRECLEKALG